MYYAIVNAEGTVLAVYGAALKLVAKEKLEDLYATFPGGILGLYMIKDKVGVAEKLDPKNVLAEDYNGKIFPALGARFRSLETGWYGEVVEIDFGAFSAFMKAKHVFNETELEDDDVRWYSPADVLLKRYSVEEGDIHLTVWGGGLPSES